MDFIKLKDIVTVAKNKTNHQTNLTLKKTKLKEMDMSEDALLNLKIKGDTFF